MPTAARLYLLSYFLKIGDVPPPGTYFMLTEDGVNMMLEDNTQPMITE